MRIFTTQKLDFMYHQCSGGVALWITWWTDKQLFGGSNPTLSVLLHFCSLLLMARGQNWRIYCYTLLGKASNEMSLSPIYDLTSSTSLVSRSSRSPAWELHQIHPRTFFYNELIRSYISAVSSKQMDALMVGGQSWKPQLDFSWFRLKSWIDSFSNSYDSKMSALIGWLETNSFLMLSYERIFTVGSVSAFC